MKLSEARKVLGLDNAATTLTEAIISEAFVRGAKAGHPDNGGFADMDALTTAKKVCLDSLQGADLACKLCGGVGKVRAKMGLTTCGSCKGTGDRQ